MTIETGLAHAAEKIQALYSEPTQPTDAHEKAEEPAKQGETKTETPKKGDTESKSRRVKAKLDDRDIEFEVLTDDVDLDLIPKGLLMESDYRKKTMALADDRKALEAEQRKIAEKVQDLEAVLKLDMEDLDTPEMQELREDYPDEYYQKYDAVQRKKERLEKYRKELGEKKDAEKLQRQKSEFDKLSQAIPEWLDNDKMKSGLDSIVETLRNEGFKDDEMGDLLDSRLIKLFHKAYLHDQIVNSSVRDKRVQRPVKSSSPESRDSRVDARSELNKSVEQLKKTGSVKDAQSAIQQLFGM